MGSQNFVFARRDFADYVSFKPQPPRFGRHDGAVGAKLRLEADSRRLSARHFKFSRTVGGDWNERGFRIEVLDDLARLRFDAARVKDAGWLESVVARCGGRLSPPPPQWTRDEIFGAAGAKLRNVILASAQIREKRYVTFTGALVYRNLQLSKFWRGLEEGWILIDFDARTQGRGLRDHGTKFRVGKRNFARLYESSEEFPSKRTQISSS